MNIRCWRLTGWLALSTVSCSDSSSSDDAHSSTIPSAQMQAPGGGTCRPDSDTDMAAEAAVGGGAAGASAAKTCPASAGVTYSTSLPVGVGYIDIPAPDDELPMHVAYLTFDDGPSDWTRDFLATLRSKGVHATFFVNAKNFKGDAGLDGTYQDENGQTVTYRDVLKETLDDGHAIGNHTVDHENLATISPDEAAAVLDDNERLVNQALVTAGGAPRPLGLIRPPYGSPWRVTATPLEDPVAQSLAVGGVVELRGFNVLWNITSSDSAEWAMDESPSRSEVKLTRNDSVTFAAKKERIKRGVLESRVVQEGRGAVVLLHDTHNTTRDVLPELIDGLVAKGYSFATIEDYVRGRFGRSSLELTPGPGLYDSCNADDLHSCADRTSDGPKVCGRMWRFYEGFGGAKQLGQPTTPFMQGDANGAWWQGFERGKIELHPENAAPCDAVLISS